MRRLFTSSVFMVVDSSDRLWVSREVLPSVVFATLRLGTNAEFVRSLYATFTSSCARVFAVFYWGLGLFIHPFHSPNNMYYKKEN